MITFLFDNMAGDWESIALRVKAEGYPVFFHKRKGRKKGEKDTAVGLLEEKEIVDDLHEVLLNFIDKKDELIIISDDTGYGYEADVLRKEGWKVINGSHWCDKIEDERSYGLDMMEESGLEVPFEKDCESIDDALEFLEGEDEYCRYVFKPEGNEWGGSSRTYTGKNRKDLIDYLKWTKDDIVEHHTEIKKFVLQEFVDGYEADFSGYVSHGKFIKDLCLLDIEEKKSGDGNKGSASGCMGNIIVNIGNSPYFEKFLKPLEKYLIEADYTGDISINNIFAKKTGGKHKQYIEGQPYGIEYTARFGWDSHLTEMAIIKDAKLKISDFYIALADGKEFNFPIGRIGCGIRVYISSIDESGEKIQGKYFSFDKSIAKNLWFYAVSYKKKSFVAEGNPVLVINTVGKNLKNTISDCYEMLKEKVNIPDVYYRMEIGQRAEEVLRFLKEHGWI